jgi:hypothetical protein
MNMLNRGLKWHKEKLDAVASAQISITDGNESVNDVTAVLGKTSFEQFSADEFIGTIKLTDWIVNADQLMFSDGPRLPKIGWKVTRSDNYGTTHHYSVAAAENGRCYVEMDAEQKMFRIHSVLERIETDG